MNQLEFQIAKAKYMSYRAVLSDITVPGDITFSCILILKYFAHTSFKPFYALASLQYGVIIEILHNIYEWTVHVRLLPNTDRLQQVENYNSRYSNSIETKFDVLTIVSFDTIFLQMYTWLKVSMKLFCYKSPFQQNLSLIIFPHALDN